MTTTPRFAFALLPAALALGGIAHLASAPEHFTFWVRPINVKLAYGQATEGTTAYSTDDVLSYLTSVQCGPAGSTLTLTLGTGRIRDRLRYRRWTIVEAQPIPRGYVCPVPLQLNDARGRFLENIKIYVTTRR